MPENPALLFALIFFSVVSFVLCWRGFRGANLPYGIMGAGFAVPTFAIGDWRAWLAGLGVFAFGFWLRQKMENI